MANANLTLLTTANTFYQEMVEINNTANSVNELRNGNYYKDGGNFTIANGTLVLPKTSGTLISCSADALVGGLLTSNTIINEGDCTVLANIRVGSIYAVGKGVYYSNNPAYVLRNNGDIYANNMQISGNLTLLGTQSIQTNRMVLANQASVPGDGFYQVYQGIPGFIGGQNAATLYWNHTSGVWQVANTITNVYSTILSTANLVDTLVNTSISSAATANMANSLNQQIVAVNANILTLFAGSNSAANLVAVYANGVLSMANANVNFNNSATVIVTVTPNGTNKYANISFAANVAALSGSLLGNPTALIGPTVINGASGTAMKSDGAPALNLAAEFTGTNTWTGNTTFMNNVILANTAYTRVVAGNSSINYAHSSF